MTVREMFEIKYREYMANVNSTTWRNVKAYAEYKKMPIPQYVMLCIEVTETDLKKWGVQYGGELEELHKAKCIASNRHRQEHGHVDRYWLTEKGYKRLGF